MEIPIIIPADSSFISSSISSTIPYAIVKPLRLSFNEISIFLNNLKKKNRQSIDTTARWSHQTINKTRSKRKKIVLLILRYRNVKHTKFINLRSIFDNLLHIDCHKRSQEEKSVWKSDSRLTNIPIIFWRNKNRNSSFVAILIFKF